MKKALLGLLLGGSALAVTLGLGQVKAQENFQVVEDFNYVADTTPAVGSNHIIRVPSVDGTSLSLVEEGDTDFMRLSLPLLDAKSQSIAFGGDEGKDLYNVAGTDVVFKIRFRTSIGHRHQMQIYNGTTLTPLNFTNSNLQYNVGGGNKTPTESSVTGVSANEWHEFTYVLVDNGDNTTVKDMAYAYLDDMYIYEAELTNDFNGRLKEISFWSMSSANRPAENIDFDYIYVGEYNGAVAQADKTKEVEVGNQFELAPSLTGTNSEYDPSISAYDVVIEDDSILTYDEETNKFEAIGEGETTVTFDFVDKLISPVETKVNIKAASGDILVEGVGLNYFSDDTISLVPGESYDLNDLFYVTNGAATNKNLVYQVVGTDGIYSLEDSTLTANAKGESEIAVKSADGNFTKNFKVSVAAGYLAELPAVGSQYQEIGVTHTNSKGESFQSAGYTGNTKREYSPISVVSDDVMGNVFSYQGVGANNNAGGSYINYWIPASSLTNGKNYKLQVFAKVSGIKGAPRVDLQVNGYNLIEGKYDYDTLLSASKQTEVSKDGEWLIYELDPVTFDNIRNEGLKLQLTSFNNTSGVTTLIGHIKLVEVEGAAELKGVAVNCGELNLSNTENNAPTLTLSALGSTAEVKVTAIPNVAALGDVTYVSSNTEVATIVEGVITAVANGETLITVTTSKGVYYLNVKVAVEKAIDNIEVADENVSIALDNKTFNIDITITPADYTEEIQIVAADPSVVSVSNTSIVEGKLYITPLKAGSTTVTLTYGENKTLVLNVTVTGEEIEEPTDKPCTGMEVDKTSVSLKVGESTTIKVTTTPSDTTDSISYQSSDTKIVTVDQNGKITAVAAGSATITITCGSQTKSVSVTVQADQTDPEPTPEPEQPNNAGMIWGIVGGVLGVIVVAGVVVFIVYKKKKQ